MSVRFATETEVEHWNSHIAKNPDGGNIFQGKEFLEQKRGTGWRPRYIFADSRAVGILEKRIPILGAIWYCPKGPGAHTLQDLENVLPGLLAFGRSHGAILIKIEPEIPHEISLEPLGVGAVKTWPVQPNWATVLVDISLPLEDILKNLPQKGRHAIRRAERDGVEIRQVETNDENCKIMYDLLKVTSDTAGFSIRSPEYYKAFYHRYGKNGQLFFAYFNDQVVAAAFAMVQDDTSMYKDGASVRERPAYGASHLLQWHVIEWAKAHGATIHDLAGCPPIDQINNPNHRAYGLGRFKTSFNKTVTQYVGAYDVPIRPMRAKLWREFFEKVYLRVHKALHHESFY